jgi:hypothetical protein
VLGALHGSTATLWKKNHVRLYNLISILEFTFWLLDTSQGSYIPSFGTVGMVFATLLFSF